LAKPPTEITEVPSSCDLTLCAWSAARLAGCDPKTVRCYVDLREAGYDHFRRTRRGPPHRPYLEKVEELVEQWRGKIRVSADRSDFR
jgi:hypothetical protein